VWQRGVAGRGGDVRSWPLVAESGVVAVWSTGGGAACTTAGAVAGAAGGGSGADWQPTAAARTTPPEASSHLDRPAKVLVISSPPLEDGSATCWRRCDSVVFGGDAGRAPQVVERRRPAAVIPPRAPLTDGRQPTRPEARLPQPPRAARTARTGWNLGRHAIDANKELILPPACIAPDAAALQASFNQGHQPWQGDPVTKAELCVASAYGWRHAHGSLVSANNVSVVDDTIGEAADVRGQRWLQAATSGW
jgi:hypothetical protein